MGSRRVRSAPCFIDLCRTARSYQVSTGVWTLHLPPYLCGEFPSSGEDVACCVDVPIQDDAAPSTWKMRTDSSSFGPYQPHSEQVRVVGSNQSIRRSSRPCLVALYSNMRTNADHPASCTDLARWPRARPDTAKSSTYTAWFSRMIFVESLWCQSRRVRHTRVPLCQPPSLCLVLASLLLARRAGCPTRTRRSIVRPRP